MSLREGLFEGATPVCVHCGKGLGGHLLSAGGTRFYCREEVQNE